MGEDATHSPPTPAEGARFDWYAATIRDDPGTITSTFAAAFDADVRTARPKHGYQSARELVHDGRVVVTVMYGGPNGWPHAWASGDDSPLFAHVCRSTWPDLHHVTRFDSAIDFDHRGAWDWLYGLMVDASGSNPGRPLKLSTIGDWITPGAPDGRTLYVGSFKSPVFVRLYEKGKQMRRQEPMRRYSDDWVRLEVQVRPEKDARFRAVESDPIGAWGFARWTTDLVERVLAEPVARVDRYEDREADDERALYWMVKQYGAVLDRLRIQLGSWEAVAADLAARMEPQP